VPHPARFHVPETVADAIEAAVAALHPDVFGPRVNETPTGARSVCIRRASETSVIAVAIAITVKVEHVEYIADGGHIVGT
jgi:hypothetical protein